MTMNISTALQPSPDLFYLLYDSQYEKGVSQLQLKTVTAQLSLHIHGLLKESMDTTEYINKQGGP